MCPIRSCRDDEGNWIRTFEGKLLARDSRVPQITTRMSGDVTIVDLQEKATIGGNSDL